MARTEKVTITDMMQMELGQTMRYDVGYMSAVRVPGGWMYAHDKGGLCFVPEPWTDPNSIVVSMPVEGGP